MTRRRIAPTAVAESAARLLGSQIRQARIGRRWTAAELAERAGVSRRTVAEAENGSPSVSLGNALNLAAIAGVDLFGITDPTELARARKRGEDAIALLPSRVRRVTNRSLDNVDLDF